MPGDVMQQGVADTQRLHHDMYTIGVSDMRFCRKYGAGPRQQAQKSHPKVACRPTRL
jgi:hypothetical protein